MRLIATALTLFVFGVGVLNAENFWCSVKKVDGNKVTLNRSTKKEKLDDVTLTTTENCKVTKAHWNKEKKKWEAGDPIEGGLKSDVLTKLAGEGVRANVITTKDNQIKEIRVHENAEEYWCSVKKVDGNKVTLNRSTKKEKLDDVTLAATENCKVSKAHWNNEKKKWEAGDLIEGGLKSAVLTKLEGEGVRAIVITNKDKEIMEIRVHEK